MLILEWMPMSSSAHWTWVNMCKWTERIYTPDPPYENGNGVKDNK